MLTIAPHATDCPAWCNDHTMCGDGTDDSWHKSADQSIAGHLFYLSTGTISGEVEVFTEDNTDYSQGMSLDDAERLARALLKAVESARRAANV